MALTDQMSISVEKGTFHVISQFGHEGICVFHSLKGENRYTCWGREIRDDNFRFRYSEFQVLMVHPNGDNQQAAKMSSIAQGTPKCPM